MFFFCIYSEIICAQQFRDRMSGWWFQSFFNFHIWDVILPINELIFFKMVIAPPTRWLIAMVDIIVANHILTIY